MAIISGLRGAGSFGVDAPGYGRARRLLGRPGSTEPERYKSNPAITSLYDTAAAPYQEGGGFGKDQLAMLERSKTKSLASAAQGNVSAGLSGTTVAGAEESKFEEEVGIPTRLGIDNARVQNLIRALMAKAGYMERSTQPIPQSQQPQPMNYASRVDASTFASQPTRTEMPPILPYYQEMAAKRKAQETSKASIQRSTNIGGVGNLTI